jgi:hypothetical protein
MRTPHWLLGSALVLSALTETVPALADDPPTFADRSDRDVLEEDRTVGLLLNPLAAAVGVYAGEVDIVLGRHFAASVEGAVYNLNGTTSTALGGGLLFYPSVAFHGFYLEPRFAYARPLDSHLLHFDLDSEVIGVGSTAGWQWTWDYGFTARLGGGGMYFMGGSSSLPNAVALRGPQLVMDGSVGWTF